MSEIGNRLGQASIYVGVGKCWILQKEYDKVEKLIWLCSFHDRCPFVIDTSEKSQMANSLMIISL